MSADKLGQVLAVAPIEWHIQLTADKCPLLGKVGNEESWPAGADGAQAYGVVQIFPNILSNQLCFTSRNPQVSGRASAQTRQLKNEN